jgi:hypothetical protein
MATTVNNTTANVRITIIFDANGPIDGDGPAKGTGNTESDVYVDSKFYENIRSHTEVPSEIHALQWNATTNTGTLEYTDNRENESISSLPQWATNVVIRCEAQDLWKTTHDDYVTKETQDILANPEIDKETDEFEYNNRIGPAAKTAANTARDDYLAEHNITY